MVYTTIAFGIIIVCIIAIVYVQHTAIRVLREEIDKLNEANDYNIPEIWRVIESTNMELRGRISNLEKLVYNQVDELEKKIRKDFDTEKTQRNTY